MAKVLLWLVKILVVLSLLILGGYWLVKSDIIPSSVIEKITGKESNLQTYYQWTDRYGKVQISRKPPPEGVQYSSFKGSKDLVTSEQLVEPIEPKNNTESKLKVLSTHRDNLKERLLDNEVTTQCRWLINQLFNLEKQILQNSDSEPESIAPLCDEYSRYVKRLPSNHCKTSAEQLDFNQC